MTARSLRLAGLSTFLLAIACGGAEGTSGGPPAGDAGSENDAGSAGFGPAGARGGTGATGATGGGLGGEGGSGDAGSAGSSGGQSVTGFGPPETLAEGLDYPVRLALDADWIYVTVRGALSFSNGSILRVRKDGGGSETLAEGRGAPFALALDGDTLYWTEVSSAAPGGVYRRLPSGAIERVLEVVGSATALFVDATRVYFGTTAATGAAVVSWANKSGTPEGSLTGFTSVFDIVAAPASGWTLPFDAGDVFSETAGSLRAIDRAGAVVNALSVEPGGIQSGIVLGETLLFTSPARGSVASVRLDDAPSAVWSADDVVSSLDQPWGIAADDAFVYFSERAEGADPYCALPSGAVKAVERTNLQGEPVALANELHCPSRIAVDAAAVYFVTNGVDGMQTGSVIKVPLDR